MKAAGSKIRLVVFSVLTLVWCGVIFAFSAQTADESQHTSGGVIYLFCRFVVTGFTTLSGEARDKLVESMQFWVRKTAHFLVYLALSIPALQVLLAADKPRRLTAKMGAALGFCLFYSITDEIHQIFVPGRAGQLRDVCIDTLGALTGLLLSGAVILLVGHIKKKNEK